MCARVWVDNTNHVAAYNKFSFTWRYIWFDEDKDYNFQINHHWSIHSRIICGLSRTFVIYAATLMVTDLASRIETLGKKEIWLYSLVERWNRQITHYKIIKKTKLDKIYIVLVSILWPKAWKEKRLEWNIKRIIQLEHIWKMVCLCYYHLKRIL